MKGWLRKQQVKEELNNLLATCTGSDRDRFKIIKMGQSLGFTEFRYLTKAEVPHSALPGTWGEEGRQRNVDITRIEFL